MYMHLFNVLADNSLGVDQLLIGVGSLVLSALAILVTIVISGRNQQKKVLTYEIASNSSVVNLDKDVSSSNLSLLLNGRTVTSIRVYVIKLFNAGNTSITPQDYPDNPSFEFTSPPYSRPLISGEVQDTGIAAKLPVKQLRSMLSIDNTEQRSITLHPPLLNPRDSLSLRVLLMADKRDSATIHVRGQIKDGEIRRYAPSPRLLPEFAVRTIVIGVCIAFAVGILISSAPLIHAYINFIGGPCVFGSIQVAGSTSFYNTAVAEAQGYNAICPSTISHITIQQPPPPQDHSLPPQNSGAGLYYVENGQAQIADSELSSHDPALHPANYSDLLDHPVGVVVFALIVNKSLLERCGNFLNLDQAHLRNIYNGTWTNWRQVDSGSRSACLPNMPITVIERLATTQINGQSVPTPSGTQEAFATYVLGGESYLKPLPGMLSVASSAAVVNKVATMSGAIGFADLSDINNINDPGGSVTIVDIEGYAPTAPLVERGDYPFWTIEHMYTRDSPDALSTSFITYVMNNFQTSDTVIRCQDMTAAAFQKLHYDSTCPTTPS